ncbi:MAG: CPBP family intramembrane glutamic endopeptidase [Methylocystis sp.]
MLGFALLLLLPGAAIRGGVLPFEFRFEALLGVSFLCLGLCAVAGFSLAELGLARPSALRHWAGCGALTVALALSVYLESRYVALAHPAPDWIAFAPFYVLVSSPCQEVVCRSIPKLIADRMQMSGRNYVLYSSVVFSLMHNAYGDPVLLANTFFAGLAWATAYLITRNIWPLIFSHAAVGSLAFFLGVA